MTGKILIVDDDPEIRNVVHIYLQNEGYDCLEAENGAEALELLNREAADLIILDIMMPGMDGIQTCRKIRETFHIPIIMLSAKGEDMDKIMGLSTGADDYVIKPFNPLELVARVKAQLRRQTMFNADKPKDSPEIRIDDLIINKERHLVTVRGEEASLTPLEFAILELLASNPGQVFSIDHIYRSVWKDASGVYSNNNLMVHIRNIREKIEPNPREPQYIKTVWGVGYKIDK